MITLQKLSRNLLLYLLLISLLWAIFVINVYYTRLINKNDCSFNFDDYVTAINWMIGFGNSFFSIALIKLIMLYEYFSDAPEENEYEYNNASLFAVIGWFLFIIVGILELTILFKSDLINGSLTTCTNNNAEFLFRLDLVSFLWIGILLILKIFQLIGIFTLKLCKDAKIYELKTTNNNKETQTEIDIVIPIESMTNNIKCLICMDNQIDILIEPCNHFCTCNQCYNKIDKKICPCCKSEITNIRQVFVASI